VFKFFNFCHVVFCSALAINIHWTGTTWEPLQMSLIWRRVPQKQFPKNNSKFMKPPTFNAEFSSNQNPWLLFFVSCTMQNIHFHSFVCNWLHGRTWKCLQVLWICSEHLDANKTFYSKLKVLEHLWQFKFSNEARQSLLWGVLDPWIPIHCQSWSPYRWESSLGRCVGDVVRMLWSVDLWDWCEGSGRRNGDLHVGYSDRY
jgi:hypothetical protein